MNLLGPDDVIGSAALRKGGTVVARQYELRNGKTLGSRHFLAPDLVKAAIDGILPYGMGVVRLADLPAEWSRQHQMLGLRWI